MLACDFVVAFEVEDDFVVASLFGVCFCGMDAPAY